MVMIALIGMIIANNSLEKDEVSPEEIEIEGIVENPNQQNTTEKARAARQEARQ